MYLDQRAHRRKEHPDSLFRRKGTVLLEVVAQGDAVKIFHDDIGSIILLEKIYDIDDAGGFLKPRQCFCLLQKAGTTFYKILLFIIGGHRYGIAHRRIAVTVPERIVFLDRYGDPQGVFQRDIGDAEATLADNITERIAIADHGTGRDLMRLQLHTALCVTVRTNVSVAFFTHTMITEHSPPPSPLIYIFHHSFIIKLLTLLSII